MSLVFHRISRELLRTTSVPPGTLAQLRVAAIRAATTVCMQSEQLLKQRARAKQQLETDHFSGYTWSPDTNSTDCTWKTLSLTPFYHLRPHYIPLGSQVRKPPTCFKNFDSTLERKEFN